MPMIRECVLTTLGADRRPHLAPLGLIEEGEFWITAPFRPSATLANLEATPRLTASFIDDARIFAGLVLGRKDWPLAQIDGWDAPRLEAALSHAELDVVRVDDDPTRPRLYCTVRRIETHRPFLGMNRAKAAVLEAAILVTRLSILPREKIDSEIAYLKIALDKTAGAEETEAWNALMARIDTHLHGGA